MKSMTCLLFAVICSLPVVAQPTFISSGKIVYESKLNMEKENISRPWLFYENNRNLPKFYTTWHNLYFTKEKTLYTKNPTPERALVLEEHVNAEDIVYTDLQRGTYAKRQAIFEQTVLISDSIRKLQWEMTNDTRTIAGFVCHKATTIILDSVYVIAFYADEILPNGGPLNYGGLPGMILGLAIPRMNLTIFATSVELSTPTAAELQPPTAKTSYNYSGFLQYITKVMQRFETGRRERLLLRALL